MQYAVCPAKKSRYSQILSFISDILPDEQMIIDNLKNITSS